MQHSKPAWPPHETQGSHSTVSDPSSVASMEEGNAA